MSLGLVFGATDGILIVADGRNSRRVGSAGTLEPFSDDTRKIAVASTVPVAVVATGKSHLRRADGTQPPVAEVIEMFLEENAAAWQQSPDPVAAIARGVATFVEKALRQDLAIRLGITTDDLGDAPLGHMAPPDELEILIAGFAGPTSRALVHRVTIDHSEVSRGQESGFEARPMATVPHRPFALGASEEHTGMPADLVEAYFDRSCDVLDAMEEGSDYDFEALDAAFILRGLAMTELRTAVVDGLRELIARDPAVFERFGVGGRWTTVELRRSHDHGWSDVALGPWMSPLQGGATLEPPGA